MPSSQPQTNLRKISGVISNNGVNGSITAHKYLKRAFRVTPSQECHYMDTFRHLESF